MLTIEKNRQNPHSFLGKSESKCPNEIYFGTSYLIIDSFQPSEFVNEQKQILTIVA